MPKTCPINSLDENLMEEKKGEKVTGSVVGKNGEDGLGGEGTSREWSSGARTSSGWSWTLRDILSLTCDHSGSFIAIPSTLAFLGAPLGGFVFALHLMEGVIAQEYLL